MQTKSISRVKKKVRKDNLKDNIFLKMYKEMVRETTVIEDEKDKEWIMTWGQRMMDHVIDEAELQ